MAIILNNNPNPFAIQFNLQNCKKVYWNENLVWPELDKQYFWLKSNSNDSLVYDYKTHSGPNITKTIKYSFDGDTWTTYTNPVSLTAGQTIYLISETTDSFYGSDPYRSCKGLSLTNDSTFTVGGNVLALFNNSSTLPSHGLDSFLMDTKVTDASRIIFPTVTSQGCYFYMFKGCTSLVSAPVLPALSLSDYCYNYMFDGCTSLVNAPLVLPATTLASYCYSHMFNGCTSLVTAPVISAITMANRCCVNMFSGCTSLTTVPDLVATTMAYECCNLMFSSCSSLVTAPALSATILDNGCYSSMFYNCTSLVNIPELPATTLADNCYLYMYQNCSSLKFSETPTSECPNEYRIPTEGTGTTASSSLSWMFTGTGGTFTGTPSINTVYYTNSGAQPVVEPNYFYIEAYSGESDLKFKFEDIFETPQTVNLLVSTDKNNWSTFQTNTYYTVASGSKMYFKAGTGGNGGTCDDTAYVSRLHFTYEPAVTNTTALARIGGDITTLLTENGQMSDMRQSGQTHNFAFLFRNGQGDGTDFRRFYINSDFEIPCSIVQPYAFWQLFRGALAPIDTANNLYNYFPDLSNIEYVGAYSFGTTWCYEQAVHFADNTVVDLSSLKGSTDGTNIADDSRYLDVGSNNGAFRNWLRYERTSFTVKIGPLEPAYYLYDGAFQDSTPSEIEVAFSSFGSGTGNWVRNVPATGTFKCPVALGDNSTIARGNNYCPNGWTVVNI